MSLPVDAMGADGAHARRWMHEGAAQAHVEGQSALHFEAGAPRNISIFGLGYVGAVSLACLARDGHRVTGVDIDQGKLELLRNGQAPIVESGIQELTRTVTRNGAVTVTDSVRDAILATDLSFVCVGTPAQGNGDQDLTAILRIAEQIGAVLPQKQSQHVIVVRSTVKPGTVEGMIAPAIESASGLQAGQDFSLCFQPEFLREGTSIHDYDHPPMTVVGAGDDYGAELLRAVFGHLPCEFVRTTIRTAEMLKYACNAFHATKVTFANEIGRVSQAVGVDPHEVMRLLCLDRQLNISPAYLRPGFAFGGSCLPKDLKALLYLAKRQDVELPMLGAILPSNAAHIEQAIERVLASGRRSVGMVGLSFKAGTDDLRESPMVVMAERFIGKGLNLRIYDPAVNIARLIGANRRFIEESIPHIASLMTDDLRSLVRDAEVLVVGMKSPETLLALAEHTRPSQLLLDVAGLADRGAHRAQYQGVCW
ncbi:MAG: nucleotide sugar dehydrogenase [Steroidobacteraceae bacterium]|jgi:GDP-mannose 6-dehydrogenase|nr:nucleotide sugar dehydrogenase [Steroidobacteraceae bacterium]